jgi:hypothetical protein
LAFACWLFGSLFKTFAVLWTQQRWPRAFGHTSSIADDLLQLGPICDRSRALRPPNDPPNVKCGQIGARSMEIFRRLGVADKLRAIGLPADYPNDIVSATSVTGIELSRVLIPARGARGTPAAAGPDTTWPTPEHTHRCNQKFFEPVVRTCCGAAPHPQSRPARVHLRRRVVSHSIFDPHLRARTPLDRTVLAHARRADHWRNHHSAGFGVISQQSSGFPGYNSLRAPAPLRSTNTWSVARARGFWT